MPYNDAFNAWQRSEAVQGLLRSLWESVEAARSANDPATRQTAWTALGVALGTFLEGIGATEQLQRQMLDHVLGEPGVDAAYVGKTFAELTRSEMLLTRGGEAILRGLAERGVLTLFGLLGGKFSAVAVGDLRRIDKGYKGLFTFHPKAGVNPDSGLAHALQEKTVGLVGYTVGSGDGQLKRALLNRAVTYYDNHGAVYGLPRTKRATVREWTQRAHAELYQTAVREGAADRQQGRINNARWL